MPKLTHEEANRQILEILGAKDQKTELSSESVMERLTDPKIREKLDGAMQKVRKSDLPQDNAPVGRPKTYEAPNGR